MNNFTFGQYVPGKSWIYKMDPRTKILLTIALIVLIFLIPDLIWMACALGIFFLIILSARINIIKILKSIKGVIFLLLFTVLLQLIYTKGTELDPNPIYTFQMQIGLWQLLIIVGLLVLYFLVKKYIPFKTIFFLLLVFIGFLVLWKNPFVDTGWNYAWTWPFDNMKWNDFNFEIYKAGLNKSGFIFLRIVLMISITQILTLTTMSTDINNGLEWILSPLKLFKIPVGVFAMLISLTLRFIPTLLSESKKIMAAQASRGVDFNEGSLKDKVNQIISLLIPMFVISFKRADELSNAMEARGYVIGAKRTKIDLLKFRFIDFFSIFVVISMFVVVILHMVGIF
jgi:energy-coupling factor transport system permease protein